MLAAVIGIGIAIEPYAVAPQHMSEGVEQPPPLLNDSSARK
jgi:hypothetical protein